MPSRRRFLHVGGAGIVALAGCSDLTNDAPTDTVTPGDPTSGSSTPARLSFGEAYDPQDGDTVKLTEACIQSSVRRVQNVDHNAVEAGPHWYLFVTVDAAAGGPPASDFKLHTADRTYDPLAVRDSYVRQQVEYVEGDAYRGGGDEWGGWILFAVPYDDSPEEPRLALDGAVAWTLPDATVERLQAEPPRFSVRSVEPPERPPADDPFDVDLTVANDGGRGTFRGAFNYTAPLYVPQGIFRAFDAGEERTFVASVDVHTSGSGSEPGDEVAARIVAPSDDAEWSVTLA